jgi:hypothetical protein
VGISGSRMMDDQTDFGIKPFILGAAGRIR